ncbi:MAG: glycosyltransferase family 39 protein [Saprospiraceae bacterium]
MIFYEKETWMALMLASIPAVVSVYLFFIAEKKRTALFLLVLSAFLLRMVMISLDPYLHDWDEKFHALVAKNMIDFPFKPMLFQNPVFPYDYKDWSYNHIWLHKQPVFLWQMALSMKVFGINLIALRLPSVLMGTAIVWLTYDLGKKWLQDENVAFIAGIISCFSFFSLELIAGQMSTDHNDVAFLFYVTLSLWAFAGYIQNGLKLKWAISVGIFVGLAILNKWLTGWLVYGGWFLYILFSPLHRKELKAYKDLFISIVVSFILFVPWQVYITSHFPKDSEIIYADNVRHIVEDLGHPGSVFYHLAFLPTAYNYFFLIFLVIGSFTIYLSKQANRSLTTSYLAMAFVLFSFFSIFVKTKMASFPYPVSGILMLISAFGFYTTFNFFSSKYIAKPMGKKVMISLLTLLMSFFCLKPGNISQSRSIHDEKRNNKIYNTKAFKKMDENFAGKYIFINCRAYENIDLMFYKGGTSYHYYPDEKSIDSIENQGYHFAAFDYNDQQKLPEYIRMDNQILLMPEELK